MSGIECAFFGTLGRDGELKTSKNGRAYVRLSVRVGDGDAAQWINVTAFDERAIAVAALMTKGARVYCEGQLKLDEWTDKDGGKRHGLSAMSWHCRLAAIGANKPAAPAKKPTAPAGNDFHDDEIPF
jgi:single-stranded DNA-binding protein